MPKDFSLDIPQSLMDKANKNNRVLVIGLDGLTFPILEKLVHLGKLPNFKGLMRNGAYGMVACEPPYRSWSGWASFMTGVNIGKHGISNIEILRPDNFKVVATDFTRMRGCRTFWKIASDQGKRVVVLTVPGTFPAEEVNGIVVAGHPVPTGTRVFTHPPELSSQLLASGFDPNSHFDFDNYDNNYRYLDSISALALQLMADVAWDLFVVAFDTIDKFHHVLTGGLAAMENIYEYLDSLVGRFLQAVDDRTTMIICSDHGMKEYRRSFSTARWLHSQGYMKYRQERKLASRQKGQLIRERDGLGRYLSYKGLKLYEKVKLRFNIPSLKVVKFPEWARESKQDMEKFDPVDRIVSHAFTTRLDNVCNCGGIRIGGAVAWGRPATEEAYQALRDEIIGKLKTITDHQEGGRPVVSQVFKREELYKGRLIHRQPDIVFLLEDGYYCERYSGDMSDIASPQLFEDYPEPKVSHCDGATLIVKGPGILHGARRVGASIMDIAPSVLFRLGCQIPDYMDGRVLDEIRSSDGLIPQVAAIYHDEGYLFPGEVSFTSAGQLDEETENEMRKLGYIK